MHPINWVKIFFLKESQSCVDHHRLSTQPEGSAPYPSVQNSPCSPISSNFVLFTFTHNPFLNWCLKSVVPLPKIVPFSSRIHVVTTSNTFRWHYSIQQWFPNDYPVLVLNWRLIHQKLNMFEILPRICYDQYTPYRKGTKILTNSHHAHALIVMSVHRVLFINMVGKQVSLIFWHL